VRFAVIVLRMKRSKGLVRRTPLLHRSELARRRWPIRPESERKAAFNPDAAAARDLVRVRDGCCGLCGQPGSDTHHRLPRGHGGALRDPTRFAVSRLVWLCRECHCWVESHRTLAYGLGLLVRRGVTRCSDVPVRHHGRWVLLTDVGQIVPTFRPAGVYLSVLDPRLLRRGSEGRVAS
jgi:5-methylcytosine-specific restriction endonuclease McrA